LPNVSGGAGVLCQPVADLASLAPRVSQPPESLLAKGRLPPHMTGDLQTTAPMSKKPKVNQHGVIGSEIATAPILLPNATKDSFPEYNDDHDGFDFSPPYQGEDATSTVEEEVFVPPLLVNNIASLNNPLQNLANATYIDCVAGNDVLLTTEEKVLIELLSLIEEFRIPLRSFGAICKWASKWSKEKTDFKPRRHRCGSDHGMRQLLQLPRIGLGMKALGRE
jgi:hypothetical protein